MDTTHQPVGQVHAARSDSDQGEVLGALVALQNFMGDAGQGARNIAGVHHDPFLFGASLAFDRHGWPACRHKKTFPPILMRRSRLSNGSMPYIIMVSLPTSQDGH